MFPGIPKVILLFLIQFTINIAAVSSRQISVVAHMVNSPEAIRWALDQGANGIEIDLNFSGETPSHYQHGTPCDCTCLLGASTTTSICNRDNVCKVSTSATVMTSFLGNSSENISSRLALIYVDSKISDMSSGNYIAAGANVVRLFNQNVMEKGFQGQILIGCPEIKHSDYLRGALQEAKKSKYAARYFYTIDGETGSAKEVWDTLSKLDTKNIAYSTGISVCTPRTFQSAIEFSLDKKAYAGVGIWTIDLESSMKDYIETGVDFILTNRPKIAAGVIGLSNIPSPGKALSFSFYWKCDCNYSGKGIFGGGGCKISKIAPPNYACKCSYKGAWTCGGVTVNCRNSSSQHCKLPNASKDACKLGGGDCDGY